MYEFEVQHGSASRGSIESRVIHAFEECAGPRFTHISLIAWGEHCTECAVPECYLTCDLYERRSDGLCRRFAHGIVPIQVSGRHLNYIVRIDFKPWAKLMAYGNNVMVPIGRARKTEDVFFGLDTLASYLPSTRWPRRKGRAGIFSPLESIVKRKLTNSRILGDGLAPDAFFLEAFNPQEEDVNLVLDVRGSRLSEIPSVHKLVFRPGFNQITIPCTELLGIPPNSSTLKLQIIPNIGERTPFPLTLYFGFVGFARFASKSPREQSKPDVKYIKAVVWDLDLTLWDGILTENSPEELLLRPGVKQLLAELDRRGILNSIASKNDQEAVWPQLRRLGVADYFVFPKINWKPKSQNVASLIADLDIGGDTVAFVDDQPFEREEVRAVLPEVRMYGHDEIENLLKLPEFNPVLSSESATRRAFYQSQNVRQDFQTQFIGNYVEFLRSCDILLNISRGGMAHLDRIHELSQRTNQLNFSGNRYTREKVLELLNDASKDIFVVDCTDRFGSYGTIGLGIVDKSDAQSPVMLDLMFSCRVQAKRVEHCFLNFAISYYSAHGAKELIALWKKTPRNQSAGEVFNDLGFEELQISDAGTLLRCTDIHHPRLENIVAVRFEGALRTY